MGKRNKEKGGSERLEPAHPEAGHRTGETDMDQMLFFPDEKTDWVSAFFTPEARWSAFALSNTFSMTTQL